MATPRPCSTRRRRQNVCPSSWRRRAWAACWSRLEWPDGHKGATDRLVLDLLYQTGMRLAELLGLKVGDADLRSGTLRVMGKRQKERIIPIGPDLCAGLKGYLAARAANGKPAATADALLVDAQGEPLARRSVQRLVTHYLSGVTTQRKRSPHVLRHTFATHMLEHGADLNAVKELLGHANLAATQVYTHNTVEKLRKVHAQAHPRGGIGRSYQPKKGRVP
jgi:integrase/recombinase XerC